MQIDVKTYTFVFDHVILTTSEICNDYFVRIYWKEAKFPFKSDHSKKNRSWQGPQAALNESCLY